MNTVVQLFRNMLEISLFASAMIIVVFLIRATTKDRLNIKIISVLWFLVVLRLCLPMMFESPVHVDGLFSKASEIQVVDNQQVSQEVIADYGKNDTVSNQQLNRDYSSPTEHTADNTISAEQQTGSFFERTLSFFGSLDLWLAASVIWIIGGIVVFVLTLKENLKFGLFIRNNSYPITDYEILDIVEDHKRAKHLRCNIKVSVCPTIKTPLTFGMFHPHILLPLHLTDKLCREYIDVILLHEVCHIKRHDILKSYVCVLAKVLHWFNPLVWISLKKIKEDMEFACDQSVLRQLKDGQETKYCESLLVATRFMKQRKIPQLAATLCESKSNLKKRIIKMVNPRKKSKSAAVVSMILALVMLTACFTTACQPTPAAPPIVNKGDGQLEKNIQKTKQPGAEPTRYTVPAHWSEKLEGAKMTVEIDTDVNLPNISKYPVVKVEPAPFSQQEIDSMVNYFAAGKKLYKPRNMTKADFEQQIVEAKRGQEVDGKYVVNESTKEWVAELEKKMAAAPDDSPKVYTDTKLTYHTDPETGKEDKSLGENFMEAMFENGNGDDGSIWVSNYLDGVKNPSFSYGASESGNYVSESFYKEAMGFGQSEEENRWTGAGALFDKVPITKEDAQAKVEKTINELGIGYFAMVGADKFVVIDHPEKGGYAFSYMRQSGGMLGYLVNGGRRNKNEELPAYSPPFTMENLIIYVNKDGIQDFSWNGRTKVTDTVNENVTLLPFDKIKEALKKQIKYKLSFNPQEGPAFNSNDFKVTVSSAELRVGYIGVKDNPNQALLVPMWVFSTKESFKNVAQGNGYIFMINAIDGGVIEYVDTGKK